VQDLAKLIGQLPIGVWVATVPEGVAIYTNAAFEAILGVGAKPSSQIEDAAGTYCIFDRAGQPYPAERLPFSRVMQTEQPVVVDDLVIHRSDGGRVNVRAFAHPIHAGPGQLSHVSVVFIDITREVQAESERDRAAERVRFAVEHAPIVIWATDAAGAITLSHGAGLASLGVQSGELVGQNVFALYADHPHVCAQIRRVLAGESLQYVVEVGDSVFDTWLTPIRDASGSVTGVTGLSHDIRDLRRLQAAGIQNDRTAALGMLAASVAHEINNPLTYILAYADQIEGGFDRLEQLAAPAENAQEMRALLDTLRDDFQTLRMGTERIATITRELRTFNHPDDKLRVAVDARGAVRSVLQLVGQELEARARLVLDLGETAPVAGHPSRLMQVVLNLVMNAMQSLPPGAARQHQISITTRTQGGHVTIEIGDSGPGVPSAQRERIFEPFVTTKPIGEGTGLGLFVCRNIVRSCAGEVTVHDRPGGGALFRVTLPVAPSLSLAVASRAERFAAGAGQAHVLVIDDDTQVGQAFIGQLERAGYRASSCSGGAVGLRRVLHEASIDLVFCDLMMHGMTGMDVHAQLQQQAPALLQKVVFMTAGACSPHARQFVLEHPEQVVEKPFDLVAETRRRLGASAAG
jgi:PAS domain S-box-containing protein